MSKQELNRAYVIRSAVEGTCTVAQAAEILGLSKRRIKQLKKEFSSQGPAAVIHGNAKRPSPRRLSEGKAQRILELYAQEPFARCNFTHFHELLSKRHGICLGYSTLYRLLTRNGAKSPKKRRSRKTLHPSRERKPALGMMLQADATPFDWLGGAGKLSLHGFIDDATGRVTGLYLCKNECLLGYLEVLRQTLTGFGIPQSLYPDRFSVFFVNPKTSQQLTIEEQLEGVKTRPTQFGRIVDQLGIDMFPASSPQAKGRVERLWETLQSRLPVELALAGIATVDAANTFLKAYVPQFNALFAVEPADAFSAFVPVPSNCDLDRLLCVRLDRLLSHGSTIKLHGRTFRIEQTRFPAKTRVELLLDERHGLRALINGAFYPIVLVDNDLKAQNPLDGHATQVLLDLVQRYLLADAKAA